MWRWGQPWRDRMTSNWQDQSAISTMPNFICELLGCLPTNNADFSRTLRTRLELFGTCPTTDCDFSHSIWGILSNRKSSKVPTSSITTMMFTSFYMFTKKNEQITTICVRLRRSVDPKSLELPSGAARGRRGVSLRDSHPAEAGTMPEASHEGLAAGRLGAVISWFTPFILPIHRTSSFMLFDVARNCVIRVIGITNYSYWGYEPTWLGGPTLYESVW